MPPVLPSRFLPPSRYCLALLSSNGVYPSLCSLIVAGFFSPMSVFSPLSSFSGKKYQRRVPPPPPVSYSLRSPLLRQILIATGSFSGQTRRSFDLGRKGLLLPFSFFFSISPQLVTYSLPFHAFSKRSTKTAMRLLHISSRFLTSLEIGRERRKFSSFLPFSQLDFEASPLPPSWTESSSRRNPVFRLHSFPPFLRPSL